MAPIVIIRINITLTLCWLLEHLTEWQSFRESLTPYGTFWPMTIYMFGTILMIFLRAVRPVQPRRGFAGVELVGELGFPINLDKLVAPADDR